MTARPAWRGPGSKDSVRVEAYGRGRVNSAVGVCSGAGLPPPSRLPHEVQRSLFDLVASLHSGIAPSALQSRS